MLSGEYVQHLRPPGGSCSRAATAQALRPASCLQIYDLESAYFTADCTNFGNVVKARRGRSCPGAAAAHRRRRRRSLLPCSFTPAPSRPLGSLPLGCPQGFNEFLTSKSAQAKNKNRQFRMEDRVFSLSSITSPGVRPLLPPQLPLLLSGSK